MKKIIIILMLVGLFGCSTTIKESRSKNLPQHIEEQ